MEAVDKFPSCGSDFEDFLKNIYEMSYISIALVLKATYASSFCY